MNYDIETCDENAGIPGKVESSLPNETQRNGRPDVRQPETRSKYPGCCISGFVFKFISVCLVQIGLILFTFYWLSLNPITHFWEPCINLLAGAIISLVVYIPFFTELLFAKKRVKEAEIEALISTGVFFVFVVLGLFSSQRDEQLFSILTRVVSFFFMPYFLGLLFAHCVRDKNRKDWVSQAALFLSWFCSAGKLCGPYIIYQME